MFISFNDYNSTSNLCIFPNSIDQDKGPGDRGQQGVEEFKVQHHCNDICKDLDLPPLYSEQSDDDDGNDIRVNSNKSKGPGSAAPKKKGSLDLNYSSNSGSEND